MRQKRIELALSLVPKKLGRIAFVVNVDVLHISHHYSFRHCAQSLNKVAVSRWYRSLPPAGGSDVTWFLDVRRGAMRFDALLRSERIPLKTPDRTMKHSENIRVFLWFVDRDSDALLDVRKSDASLTTVLRWLKGAGSSVVIAPVNCTK